MTAPSLASPRSGLGQREAKWISATLAALFASGAAVQPVDPSPL